MSMPPTPRARCGLCKVTVALPGHERAVAAPSLVYLHDHDDEAAVRVVTPTSRAFNRWRFEGEGLAVHDRAWVATLERLPGQGFYALAAELGFDGGAWPRSTLVQLGYTRRAEPVVFIAQLRAQLDENDLVFATTGVRLPPERLATLLPLVVHDEPGGYRDEAAT